MKLDTSTVPLFYPDILDYIKGREEVCKIVLSVCEAKAIKAPTAITLHTNLLTTLNFKYSDITNIIQHTGKQLLIRFSYSLLIQLDENSSVECLATLLWKYMHRVIKSN